YGLTLNSNGTITGTPTAAGTCNFTAKVTDSANPVNEAVKGLSIRIWGVAYGWTRRLGGSSGDVGYGIATDGSGNVYVTGCFQGTVNFRADFGGGSDNKTSAGSNDVFVTKIEQ
ncbi:MAG: SBBP repeat-containing protein, partial [Planctomycetota bacterium]|nr:SBBP repeat-containing protein [Planctomycetota bacterium]